MNGKIHVESVETLYALATAVASYADGVQEYLLHSNTEIDAFREWISERGRHWSREVESCEAELRQATADLAACRNSGDDDDDDGEPDCTEYEERLDDARFRLESARRELATVRRWTARVRPALLAFRAEQKRLDGVGRELCPQGQAFLRQYASALEAYAGVNAPDTEENEITSAPDRSSKTDDSVGYLSSSDGVAEPETSAARTEAILVAKPCAAFPVDLVGSAETRIESEADFIKVPFTVVADGLEKLQRVVGPGVLAGASRDSFSEMDARRSQDPVTGYLRAYDSFFGANAVRVVWDGRTWSVDNGRHRLWAARRLGIATLPASVVMSAEAWVEFGRTGTFPSITNAEGRAGKDAP